MKWEMRRYESARRYIAGTRDCRCDARTSFPLGTLVFIGIVITFAVGKRKQKMIFDRIVNVDGKD